MARSLCIACMDAVAVEGGRHCESCAGARVRARGGRTAAPRAQQLVLPPGGLPADLSNYTLADFGISE
jgi:hypothetical protein